MTPLNVADNGRDEVGVYGISLLIVDDDPAILATESEFFRLSDIVTKTASTSREALDACDSEIFDVILTDLKMPEMSGLDLLKKLKEKNSNAEVILFTGFGSVETAIEAIKYGAFSYMLKPTNLDRLLAEVKNAAQTRRLKLENFVLKHSNAKKDSAFYEFKSESMIQVMELLKVAAESESAILLCGESGSGKEIAANYIHSHSKRAKKPFIKAHCSSFSEGILESEIFGHEKGAFTGATTSRQGRFELANQGTIFLDEISTVSIETQIKLLRVLQEKTIERVGGSSPIKTDFRLITATNESLTEMLNKGTFRKDLYYRISVIPVELPPLRELKKDIPNLANFLVKKASKQLSKRYLSISDSALSSLSSYSWPGNIRELQNVIERAVVLTRSKTIENDDLPIEITAKADGQTDNKNSNNLRTAIELFEKSYISRRLSSNSYNITQTALELGISRRNLQQKVNKYSLK